jgi:hypothetical protein
LLDDLIEVLCEFMAFCRSSSVFTGRKGKAGWIPPKKVKTETLDEMEVVVGNCSKLSYNMPWVVSFDVKLVR